MRHYSHVKTLHASVEFDGCLLVPTNNVKNRCSDFAMPPSHGMLMPEVVHCQDHDTGHDKMHLS